VDEEREEDSWGVRTCKAGFTGHCFIPRQSSIGCKFTAVASLQNSVGWGANIASILPDVLLCS
jgi:hypothetical protein